MEVASAIYLPPRLVRLMPFRGQAAQIPVRSGKLVLATPKRIARIQASGARVDFWTINDLDEARRLLAMGADGIMTDDPKTLSAIF
jgi:glycerophosphoryl diester phosphodiesterase